MLVILYRNIIFHYINKRHSTQEVFLSTAELNYTRKKNNINIRFVRWEYLRAYNSYGQNKKIPIVNISFVPIILLFVNGVKLLLLFFFIITS
jgi:hypothetical protein